MIKIRILFLKILKILNSKDSKLTKKLNIKIEVNLELNAKKF